MDQDKLSQFTRKVFGDMAGAMSAGLVYLGIRTGLFQVMTDRGPLTAEQVAGISGLHRRYVLEWLHGMVSAGYLEYDPDEESYALPDEHAYLLASEGTDHYAGGLFFAVPGFLGTAPRVARAFREGGGVPFEDFLEEGLIALDWMNWGNYENRLVSDWLPELPQVVEALEKGGSALDVGTGVGRVPVALARSFPEARFVGLDMHADSLRRAREFAEETGVEARVGFRRGSLEQLRKRERFDLVTVFDALHDLHDPIDILERIRGHLTRQGTLFVMEPRVADRLEDNRNPVATMFYGFSVLHCMTQSLAKGGPGLGTCLGPSRTERLCREAGFTRFRTLPIKSRVNLFYEVRP